MPGEDVPEVVLTITRGHLSEDGLQLPKGLAFYPDVDVEDESKMPSPMVYHLKGAPARDAKGGSLTITAVRKGKVSKPVDFQVTIAVPPLKWSPLEIGSALLVAGTPITVSPSYKLVDGAEKLAVKSGSMPAGLAVKEEGKGSWYLSGTPEAAAQAVLTLSAQGTGGKPEERELKLTIAAPAKPVEPVEPVDPVDPVVPVVPVVTPDVPLVKDDGPATPIAGEPAESPKVEKPKPEPVKEDKLDRKMQDFLLTRIQSSAYPEERRNSMAKAVDRITNARHLGTVTFDTGKSELNDKAANSLQESLNSQKNGDYLHTEGLTIIVVGYASTSGNAVKNRALSLRRARAVEQHLIKYMGRAADLVVDYGPTDVLSGAESENQAVEIFAGVVPDDEKVRQLLLELQRELKRKFGS